MPSRTARPRVIATVGLIVVASLLAACSSSDDTAQEDAAGTSTTSATADDSTATSAVADGSLTLEAASTRPEYVTGGEVLVAVRGDAADPETLALTLDGAATEVAWTEAVGEIHGLVTGLEPGDHELVATAGDETATLVLTAHPVTGPVFSGPPLPLEACSTETYGLGAPVDDDCSAAEVVRTWSYIDEAGERQPLPDPTVVPDDVATLDDGETPFIIREEKGTINRAVYWITVLDPNPDPEGTWDDAAWNGRLVYEFGGGCGVTYSQGFKFLAPADQSLLAAGYAHATATFNTLQVSCNSVLSAETVMMVKEHFAETYAPPELTIGTGGSGGAIQQYQIVQNYPGLLDAASPLLPFPDAISISTDVLDCGLLQRAFRGADAASLSDEAKLAITGHLDGQTCAFWEAAFVPTVNPANCTLDLLAQATGAIDGLAVEGLPPAVDESLVYDAETNPDGRRCTLQDSNINILGRNPETGFAERPWDNEGVQYGLAALNEGTITPEEFVLVNRAIGSFDIDGVWTDERSVATDASLTAAYATGLVNQGGGDLRRIPIIEVNIWTDDAGDIHTRDRAFASRERVRLPDGTDAPNLMLWTRGLPEGEDLVDSLTGNVGLGLEVVSTLDEWATAAAAEVPDRDAATDEELAATLESTRPDDAVDNCVTAEGERVSALDLYDNPGPCSDPYPVSRSPRTVAGAPLTNDILKCQLQPVADAVEEGIYEVELTDEQLAQLEEIFPTGVCDWTQPSVGYAELRGTWLDFTD